MTAPTMRKRHHLNNRMTRTILLISFILLLGRVIYASIGAWYHHQEKVQSQQINQPVTSQPR